jgi:hypothetical protein
LLAFKLTAIFFWSRRWLRYRYGSRFFDVDTEVCIGSRMGSGKGFGLGVGVGVFSGVGSGIGSGVGGGSIPGVEVGIGPEQHSTFSSERWKGRFLLFFVIEFPPLINCGRGVE